MEFWIYDTITPQIESHSVDDAILTRFIIDVGNQLSMLNDFLNILLNENLLFYWQ